MSEVVELRARIRELESRLALVSSVLHHEGMHGRPPGHATNAWRHCRSRLCVETARLLEASSIPVGGWRP